MSDLILILRKVFNEENYFIDGLINDVDTKTIVDKSSLYLMWDLKDHNFDTSILSDLTSPDLQHLITNSQSLISVLKIELLALRQNDDLDEETVNEMRHDPETKYLSL